MTIGAPIGAVPLGKLVHSGTWSDDSAVAWNHRSGGSGFRDELPDRAMLPDLSADAIRLYLGTEADPGTVVLEHELHKVDDQRQGPSNLR